VPGMFPPKIGYANKDKSAIKKNIYNIYLIFNNNRSYYEQNMQPDNEFRQRIKRAAEMVKTRGLDVWWL
jgi:hypothetical protein